LIPVNATDLYRRTCAAPRSERSRGHSGAYMGPESEIPSSERAKHYLPVHRSNEFVYSPVASPFKPKVRDRSARALQQ